MKKFIIGFVLIAVSLFGADRSPHWAKVRKDFAKANPNCALCGSAKDIQIHHVQPFHLYPELELQTSNLITLCTSKYWGFNCHFSVGHGGNFKWENPNLLDDIKKIKEIVSRYSSFLNAQIEIEEYLQFIKARVKAYNIYPVDNKGADE